MYGFGVSMSNFIGPTANIQMGMPVEISMKKFFDDSTISDSVWTIDCYQKLIPQKLKIICRCIIPIMQGLQGEEKLLRMAPPLIPSFIVTNLIFL